MILALAGLLVVAHAGWVDDRRGSSVGARLTAHLFAAMTLLPLVSVPAPIPAWMGWGAVAWWALWAVSAVNVVNFIDGIDGLIGTQALVFGLYILLIALTGTRDGHGAAFGAVLAGASAGFLLWNWPPAKIFLGDVGSGALGFAMVLGGILLMRETGVGVVQAFLPLYPIFLDASATLVARRLRGERLTEAHRSHLYQRLANGGWGHAPVTLAYGGTSLLGVLVGVADLRYRGLWFAAYFAVVAALGAWLHRKTGRAG
jgi:Fuc2NAc and GlcNAc transferase